MSGNEFQTDGPDTEMARRPNTQPVPQCNKKSSGRSEMQRHDAKLDIVGRWHSDRHTHIFYNVWLLYSRCERELYGVMASTSMKEN